MSKFANLSRADIEAAVADAADAAKPAELLPTVTEAAAAFGVEPTPNGDGTMSAEAGMDPSTAQGRKRMGLYRELMERSWRAQSSRAREVRGRQPKVRVRGPRGERMEVPERFAEVVERKHHAPRTTIMVPEMPWKRKKSRKRTED